MKWAGDRQAIGASVKYWRVESEIEITRSVMTVMTLLSLSDDDSDVAFDGSLSLM